ncbi:MAG TPA: hypothetical protein VKU36_02680 [Candidatus Babeliales bacterium]|nr:hypothetical protein [Candidatus Babeliales bacterium]
MKYSNFLFILIASTSLYSFTQELPLQQLRVSKKAIEIEGMMKRDTYLTYTFTALSVAQTVYPLITLSLQQKEVKAKEAKKENNEKAPDIPLWQSVCQGMIYLAKTPVYLIKDTLTHLFFTQEGWKSLALASVSLAGNQVISRVCDKFIHPNTLRWYAHSHAQYDVTITLIKERLTLLQNPVLEEQQREFEQKFLSLLSKRLVHQSEALCAYMMYKSKHLSDEEKEIAQRAVRTFFTVQNYWLPRIVQQVHNNNYQECATTMIAYEDDMRCHINHFSIIEGETLEERRFVKRLVKRLSEQN